MEYEPIKKVDELRKEIDSLFEMLSNERVERRSKVFEDLSNERVEREKNLFEHLPKEKTDKREEIYQSLSREKSQSQKEFLSSERVEQETTKNDDKGTEIKINHVGHFQIKDMVWDKATLSIRLFLRCELLVVFKNTFLLKILLN